MRGTFRRGETQIDVILERAAAGGLGGLGGLGGKPDPALLGAETTMASKTAAD